MTPEMKYHVFISYAFDDLDWARSLHTALLERGLKVWFNEQAAGVGVSFVKEIEAGLKASHTTLFLITRSAAQKLSPEDTTRNWMRQEYDIAIRLMNERRPPMNIVAIRVANADLPPTLGGLTWVSSPGLPVDSSRLDQVLAAIQTPVQRRDLPTTQMPHGVEAVPLAGVVASAQDSLHIFGHTLDKFSQSGEIREAISGRLKAGVKVVLVLLNPHCPYAKAHEPFHLEESRTSAQEEIQASIGRFVELFKECGAPRNFSLYATHYMPRFRSVLVDDDTAYLHFYLYGHDVPSTHDLVVTRDSGNSRDASLFAAVSDSAQQLLNSADIVPIIRDGVHYPLWPHRVEAASYAWDAERRKRCQTTMSFYRSQAHNFKVRTYDIIEPYVRRFLQEVATTAMIMKQPVLVVGCGPGKEVLFLDKLGCTAFGIDFSRTMIELARADHPHLADRFLLDDFNNLDAYPAAGFGGFVANASFVHLPDRADLPGILRQAHRALQPGGLIFLRVLNKRGVRQEFDDCLFGNRRWFVYFTLNELGEAVHAAGFDILQSAEPEHAHYDHVTWPCVLARKPGAAGEPVP